uniref:Core domain-containing protein n=1 Tax=Kalanchoe fedtschenkoi TaxID=63787 RepID=A0A7N0T9D0_KALFE
MALTTIASATRCPSAVQLSINSSSACSSPSFVSLRSSSASVGRRKWSIRATSASAAPIVEEVAPPITLTENALKHLNRMRSERRENLCLRIGVKQGGCSGMSYMMDFESKENARPDDSIIECDGFTIVMHSSEVASLSRTRTQLRLADVANLSMQKCDGCEHRISL